MDGSVPPKAQRLRMADLVARTGVSAQTIRYYVNEGLLPKPRKSARNMAWYSEQHVELVTLIRALQQEHFLPLRAIRAALHDTDDYTFTAHQRMLIDLARRRIEARQRRDDEAVSLQQVADACRIDDGERQELREYGLLSQDGADPAGDARVLQLWARMRDNGINAAHGFRPRDLAVVHDVVDVLFDRELQLFSERMRDLPASRIDAVLEKVVPAIADLIGTLNERRIAAFVSRFNNEAPTRPEDPS